MEKPAPPCPPFIRLLEPGSPSSLAPHPAWLPIQPCSPSSLAPIKPGSPFSLAPTLCTRTPAGGEWPLAQCSGQHSPPQATQLGEGAAASVQPTGGHHLLQELLDCGQVPAAVAQGHVLQGCSQWLPGPRALSLAGATVHQEKGQPRVLPGSGFLDDPCPSCHHLQLPGTPPLPPHLTPLPPLHPL